MVFFGGGDLKGFFFCRRGEVSVGMLVVIIPRQKKKLFYLALSNKQSIQLSNSSDVVRM